MKIWTCGSSPRSGSRNAWTRIKNVNGANRLSKFGIFSAPSKWFPVGRDWWPWTKPGYITMTRRQSNNQWNGGIAAHPAPKNSECKNPLEKFSPWFFGIKTASSSLFSSKGPNYQRGVLLISVGAIEGHLKEKCRGKVAKGVLFLHDNTPAHRDLQPRRNRPTWASIFFIAHPILRIWPHRTTTCSLDWKKTIESLPFFFRRGGNCCRGDLVGRTTFWFFFEWLAKVRKTC